MTIITLFLVSLVLAWGIHCYDYVELLEMELKQEKECVDFYADTDNWKSEKRYDNRYIVDNDYDENATQEVDDYYNLQNKHQVNIGGGRARKVVKERVL